MIFNNKLVRKNANLETAVATLPLDIQHQIIKPTITAKFVLKLEIMKLQEEIDLTTIYIKGILKPKIEELHKNLLSFQEEEQRRLRCESDIIKKALILFQEEQKIEKWQSAIREKYCLSKVSAVEYEKWLLEGQIEDIETHLTEFTNATADFRQREYSSEEKIKLMVKGWLSSSSCFSPSVETKNQVLGKKLMV